MANRSSGIQATALLLCLVLGMTAAAEAQNVTIGAGQPGPVVKRTGLLTIGYNLTGSPGGLELTMAPGSPLMPAVAIPANTEVVRLINPNIDIATTQAALIPGVADNYIMVVWEGFVILPAAGDYLFRTISDDGIRCWLVDVAKGTPDVGNWNYRGENAGESVTLTGLAAGRIAVRVEMFEGAGGAAARLRWTPPGATGEVAIPTANLEPPDGPNAPVLTVVAPANNPTPQINISWTPSGTGVAATSWILSRGTAPGGPYTQFGAQTGTTFTDTSVTFGQAYYYVVQGTAMTGLLIGTPSTEQTATSQRPAIEVSPFNGLQVSESGTTTGFTVTVNTAAPAGTVLTITSNDPSEAFVSSAAVPTPAAVINIPLATGFTGAIPITITGVDDSVSDGDITYTITPTVTNYPGLVIATTSCTTIDDDTPGITINPTTVSVGENGGTVNFLVVLNSQPTGNVVINLVSSDPAQFTVTPFVTLTTANWNTGVTATVTGVNDAIIETNRNYPLVTSVDAAATADALYDPLDPADLIVVVIDDEAIPDADEAWGCGALGVEAWGVLALLALLRRRKT